MQQYGETLLQVSLFIYAIQFLPQIIHNLINKNSLVNISILTQFGMLFIVLCDLVQEFHNDAHWSFILIPLIYCTCLTIQQLQISLNNRNLNPVINLMYAMLLSIAFLAIRSNNTLVPQTSIVIELAFNFAIWVPQIHKNIKQKRCDGYSLLFVVLSLVAILCELASSLIITDNIVIHINLIVCSFTICFVLYQKFYYRNTTLQTR
ncbi:PQ-loop domain-containing transporter [Francisella adeliensis]|uniref:PQ-loop repeat-containing protein n=1 Tax=Francisella adeliensis TaxID=2007306 RepID=A0A2Z4XZN5_9GAMM|nr:PQ-loop domain-containing transporter [Francisella adeliensis]AXA34108.1 hypothetical protein CDH04_06665 [Francisella adeliensis]MBK2085276.1 hypothetical protein [Francisella adeliensis]MBK2095956.1 hypothetical protein [Francisella adeliensis]QIW12350.1 hypothetical protein FZC43_06665 [Francisella adeliensis]QIW14224.1 hypothetical protein FZC44_06665 [Francisella adeliensis]